MARVIDHISIELTRLVIGCHTILASYPEQARLDDYRTLNIAIVKYCVSVSHSAEELYTNRELGFPNGVVKS